MSKRQHYLWSKKEGTEALRIIASISWGCVGDGGAGISLSSSQSNGIYVQRGSLQQGNKYLSPPVTHCHSLASYSLRHLSIFAICVFIFPFPRSSFSFFCSAFLQSQSQRERKGSSEVFFSPLFTITFGQCTVVDVALWPNGVLYIQSEINLVRMLI